MRTKILFTGFAPNLTLRDVRTSLSYLLFPWRWKRIKSGDHRARAEKKLQDYFGYTYGAVTFDSGRSALYVALKALKIEDGDEVLVQAFTCVVVINAIKHSGATPIYIDIDDSYNMDSELIEAHISKKTKAIIVQHTFGAPARIDAIKTIANRHGLSLIEDCAHSLGAQFQNKLLGTFGDIAVLSFGTEKVISCVRGGAIICKNFELLNACHTLQKTMGYPDLKNIVRQLMHSPIFLIGKLSYGFGIGKWLLYIAKKIYITAKIIDDEEKRGVWPLPYPAQLPNALAHILCDQLNDINRVNEHRKKIAARYDAEIKNNRIKKLSTNADSITLRYPIQMNDRTKFIQNAKSRGILLGDWYGSIVAPSDVDMTQMNYNKGSCPRAEEAAKAIVNLPTERDLTMRDVDKIILFCNSYA